MDVSSTSCEPMDIDQSMNSVKNLDNSAEECPVILPKIEIKSEPLEDAETFVSVKETVKPVHWNVKKFHIMLQTRKKQSFFRTNFVVMSTIMAFISLFAYSFMNIHCVNDLPVHKIENKLSNKLYGQQMAVKNIVEMLNVPAQSKLIFFYGGTGVGKTYAASLILNDVWNYSNIYHFTMPSFKDTFSSNLMLGLTLCKSTVMVVDNLSVSDMDISSQIKEVIDKAEHLQRNITIILIYNCDTVNKGFRKSCNTYFVEDLKDNFTEIKAFKRFVKFVSLSEEHLRKCIVAEVGEQHISEWRMQNILRNFDVASDGCKGVHMKMKFLYAL